MCKWISFVHTKQVIVLTNQDLHMLLERDALVEAGEGGQRGSKHSWILPWGIPVRGTSGGTGSAPTSLQNMESEES